MPRKPLDSWVFSLLHLCAPVLPKGIIFASGALFVGAGRGPPAVKRTWNNDAIQ